MKQLKVSVKKRGEQTSEKLSEQDEHIKSTLERLRKKGLNPMQMCQKLIEHDEVAPGGETWCYDLVVSECKRLKVPYH